VGKRSLKEEERERKKEKKVNPAEKRPRKNLTQAKRDRA